MTLIANAPRRSAPIEAADLRLEAVRFRASDGVLLAGSFALASRDAPTVVLAHGFKTSRAEMLPWARFLREAGYNVLLFDSRGCGESEGWAIGAGATEPRDIIGAVRHLRERGDLADPRVAVLGISLNAGAAVLAAAREPGVSAVVADSAWADEDFQLARLRSIRAGSLDLPLPPYGTALLDALVGAPLEAARPSDEIAAVAPRPVLLIHSADDGNATTPLSGARLLFQRAGEPKELWVAERGGHVGALETFPEEYRARVLGFLRRSFPPR